VPRLPSAWPRLASAAVSVAFAAGPWGCLAGVARLVSYWGLQLGQVCVYDVLVMVIHKGSPGVDRFGLGWSSGSIASLQGMFWERCRIEL
jgi:hypothetical protein